METGLPAYSTATTCQLRYEPETKRYLRPKYNSAPATHTGDHCQGTYTL